MLILGVLCFTASVLAQPALYLQRSSLEYPYAYPLLYPFINPSIGVAAKSEALIPEAPVLEPLHIIKYSYDSLEPEREESAPVEEPKEEPALEAQSEQEPKEEPAEEPKKEEAAEEPKKEEAAEEKKPVIVKFEIPKPPTFLTNLMSNLPFSLPQISFPLNWQSIFGKPRSQIVRYHESYEYPYVLSNPRFIIGNK